MWTREELKNNAKAVLKQRYWMAFAVTLVYGVITGAFSGTGSAMSNSTDTMASTPESRALLLVILMIALVVSILGMIVALLVGGPMQVGLYRFYMVNRERKADFGELFWGFQGGRYWKNVKVMFLMGLKVFLWSLLLIVPGIIKAYEYYMVPYLLAENPDLETSRYFEISKKMTDGEKMNIFVLGLSFLGWILLGVLACCVGTLFVQPYIFATDAELYALMRAKATATGIAGGNELRGFGPEPYHM